MLTQLLFIMLNHLYTGGRNEVALPKKPGHEALGKSRQQAVRRDYTNEGYLHKHCIWDKFQSGGQENFDLGHAERVDQDQDIQTKHLAWREQIPLLEDKAISRYYFADSDSLCIEFYGFSDVVSEFNLCCCSLYLCDSVHKVKRQCWYNVASPGFESASK